MGAGKTTMKLAGFLIALCALGAAPLAIAATMTATVAQTTEGYTCGGPVDFNVNLSLTGFDEGSNVTIVPVSAPNQACARLEPATLPIPIPASGAATAVYSCRVPNPADVLYPLTFNATDAGNQTVLATLPFDGDTADTLLPTLTAQRLEVPRIALVSAAQSPAALNASDPNAPVAFEIELSVTGATHQNASLAIAKPTNYCTGNETLDPAASDYATTTVYTCTFANRAAYAAAPPALVWTVLTNLTGCTATYSWARPPLVEAVTIAAGAPLQQCTTPEEQLATFQVNITTSGTKANVTAPPNCTAVWDSRDALGTGMRQFSCSFPQNTSVTAQFVANGDSSASASVVFPASVAAAAPSVIIGNVVQALLLPPLGGVDPALAPPPANVTYTVPVTFTGAVSATVPPQCTANTTGVFPQAVGAAASLVYKCTFALPEPGNATGGDVGAAGKILADLFQFRASTDAAGCYALAARNLTVRHEPAVIATAGVPAQGCMASNTSSVRFKVPVTYAGSVMAPEAQPPQCVQTSGNLGADTGAGALEYTCTFDGRAAAEAAALNFTAVGRIAGQRRTAAVAPLSPVIAVQPAVAIVEGPTQTSLLRNVDASSPINFTVTATFTGAVAGLGKNLDNCIAANESSGVDTSGPLTFMCTFANASAVEAANNITFKALTAAADCTATDSKPFVIAREPAVSAAVVDVRQACLADVASGPVVYEVDVRYTGAKRSRTYPASKCVETAASISAATGAGLATYTCTFANAAAVTPLVFGVAGLISDDTFTAAAYTLPTPVKSSPPVVTVAAPVQDVLAEGDNKTAVIYSVSVTATGAEYLTVDVDNGACFAATRLPAYEAGGDGAVRLAANATVKVDYVCGFPNATVVPASISFTAHTLAKGCSDTENVTLTVARTAAAEVVPYTFDVRFGGMDYDTLMADEELVISFKQSVRRAVSEAVGLPIGNVEVVNLTKGSIVAEVVLHTPATWTPEQVNAAATVMASPEAVFTPAFREQWKVTEVSVTTRSELPKVKTTLSQAAQVGIGVGVGVGGAALIGAGIAFFVARKRNMNIEPRERLV